MKRRTRWFFSITLLYFLFFAACASAPTVTGVWMNEEYSGRGINKVLVIGVSNQVPTKRMFEDQFISQLKNKGIDAVAGYRVMQSGEELGKVEIREKTEDLNVDTILITKVVAKNGKKLFIRDPLI